MGLRIASVGVLVAVVLACMVAGGKGWRPPHRGWLFVALLLLLAAGVVAVAWDTVSSPGDIPELSAGFEAMVVGAAGGAVAAAILLVGRTERPSPRPVALDAAMKVGLALALVVAFGVGSCWLGFGVASLVRR
jgi:peptidoglycan/LPS O-acetylase OafA/YrhL